ncbi:hypothetical protein EUGRSUZ_K01142 [Eucalyptus grandis]|uniref:Uncharacterized protein n=2 Tax=Eucalyptus grandis TaxID=71139 RepID=A0ACC3ITW1_EUCGR|nr:hypothetical protein EUGRSUZ_K01142 [Eucalyptus grandis]
MRQKLHVSKATCSILCLFGPRKIKQYKKTKELYFVTRTWRHSPIWSFHKDAEKRRSTHNVCMSRRINTRDQGCCILENSQQAHND